MGEKIEPTKRVSVPLQCGWCEQIQVGTTWMPERRTLSGGRYFHGICPRCAVDYHRDAMSQPGRRRR